MSAIPTGTDSAPRMVAICRSPASAHGAKRPQAVPSSEPKSRRDVVVCMSERLAGEGEDAIAREFGGPDADGFFGCQLPRHTRLGHLDRRCQLEFGQPDNGEEVGKETKKARRRAGLYDDRHALCKLPVVFPHVPAKHRAILRVGKAHDPIVAGRVRTGGTRVGGAIRPTGKG